MSIPPLTINNCSSKEECYLSITGHKGPVDCEFKTQLSKDKTLTIFLSIIREDNPELKKENPEDPERTLWGIEGKVVLKKGTTKKVHKIELSTLAITETKSIGSWHEYFVKPNSENCDNEIPRNDLGIYLRDTSLLNISAGFDSLNILSDDLVYVEVKK